MNGVGFVLVAARYASIFCDTSGTEANAPPRIALLLSCAKNPSTTFTQLEEVGAKCR
jgi:hypothetical protein